MSPGVMDTMPSLVTSRGLAEQGTVVFGSAHPLLIAIAEKSSGSACDLEINWKSFRQRGKKRYDSTCPMRFLPSSVIEDDLNTNNDNIDTDLR
ncbi:hypothetical protein ElyMa_002989100 [Elysia marginata]|uniref:Uncharacterized protein n=1 Tax=Elysia marginata TaxID=1093978 RepID=A0AAV4IFT6_9GAST|nr:hypothetical protein ElyMa_002989100 [Elysia marginata]